MDFWNKLVDIYTSTAEYIGVISLSITIVAFLIAWIKSGRKRKKSQRILNRLCKCKKKDKIKIVIPYHELSPSLYGTRKYVLADEMDEIQRLYHLFWETYGFQKIALPPMQEEAELNIFIGGPAVSPEASRCFHKYIPNFRCFFYGKEKQYKSSQNDYYFFECKDSVSENNDIQEGFYFVNEESAFQKHLSVKLVDGKRKDYFSDYALFIRIEESDINKNRSNIIMFGQSSCGTQTAVDFFINHYDKLNMLVKQNGHENENFMFCFDVIPIKTNNTGTIDVNSLVDLSGYLKK